MIVGITGEKGSGKSTAAIILLNQGFTRLSFAATLKKMTKVLLQDLGFSDEEINRYMTIDKEVVIPKLGVSARHIMQTLGTEWGRELIHPDLWIMTTETAIERLPDGVESDVVFDDVRFDNEADMIARLGGKFAAMKRDTGNEADAHPSENGLTKEFGEVIENNGTVEQLEEQLIDLIHPM